LFEIDMRIIAFVGIAIVVAISCGLFVDSSVQSDESESTSGKYVGASLLFVACSGWAYFVGLISYGVFMIAKRTKQNHDLVKEGQLVCKLKH
tara:strand:- start:243 stop:518 length:276 start_codon:yes stop_codon:yes gene_type:complete